MPEYSELTGQIIASEIETIFALHPEALRLKARLESVQAVFDEAGQLLPSLHKPCGDDYYGSVHLTIPKQGKATRSIKNLSLSTQQADQFLFHTYLWTRESINKRCWVEADTEKGEFTIYVNSPSPLYQGRFSVRSGK